MPRLVMHLLGSPRLLLNGAPVEVDTRKAIALMAYLSITGETHQRDSLAALLWPDYDQTSARAALRRTLSTLNHAIAGEEGSVLAITRESLGLKPSADLWVDVRAFRQSAAEGAQHGHPANTVCARCLEALERAVNLYPEPFMAGFNLRDSPNFEEWQFFQAETLQRELSIVLEKLVRGLCARGQIEDAIRYARRWLSLDPLHEEAHRQLMVLFTQADQRNAALRQYRECVRILDQELGVAPLEETTALYEAILNRQPLPAEGEVLRFVEMENAPTSSQGQATKTAGQPVRAPVEPPSAPAAEPATAPASLLVSRDREWRQLRKAYEEAASGNGRFAAFIGEAGIGKTYLADRFLAMAREGGARVIQARCYAGETGLAYAPFIDGISAALSLPGMLERIGRLPPAALADAGRLLPAIRALENLPTYPQEEGDGLQARFFESLRQVILALLSGNAPGILFIDDLHWADTATLDLLTYLARRLKGAPLFLLAAWRNDASDPVLRLNRLASELARENSAILLPLKRLDSEAVVELVRAYPGAADQAEALGRRLYAESEGLPFIAVEYLSAFAQRGSSLPQSAWEIPSSVRDLLRSRLSGLDAASLQLLSTAAVIGRSFDFSTLREISGRSEIETVEGLEHLLSVGLVLEQAEVEPAGREIRYDFTHEKLRALIYEETSQTRRRLLHRRVADTLARLPTQRAGQAGLVAYHYEQAGQSREAAEFHRLAGEQARGLFANTEALAHFQSALAGGHPDAAGIHEAIGDLHTLQGDYTSAIASYQAAAALCSPGCLSNLEHKLGNVQQRMGNWDLAESHYQASLEAAGQGAEADTQGRGEQKAEEDLTNLLFQVHLFADRSLVAHAMGKSEKAQELALRAQALAQSAGDPHALAQACNMLGVLARARGELDQAATCLEESLHSAESLNDPLARIAALNNLALVYGEQGKLDQAIKLAGQALELCQKRGDRHREAALHNNLADLLHQAGRAEEAMDQLKQAVVIFTEIGSENEAVLPGQTRAEIWKLTEW